MRILAIAWPRTRQRHCSVVAIAPPAVSLKCPRAPPPAAQAPPSCRYETCRQCRGKSAPTALCGRPSAGGPCAAPTTPSRWGWPAARARPAAPRRRRRGRETCTAPEAATSVSAPTCATPARSATRACPPAPRHRSAGHAGDPARQPAPPLNPGCTPHRLGRPVAGAAPPLDEDPIVGEAPSAEAVPSHAVAPASRILHDDEVAVDPAN